jgi:hypothetical protein
MATSGASRVPPHYATFAMFRASAQRYGDDMSTATALVFATIAFFAFVTFILSPHWR